MNGYNEKPFGAIQLKNINEITPDMIKKIVENLNITGKMLLKIRGYIFLQKHQFEGWTQEVPLYLFKCETHGYEITYPIGYTNRFVCLDCIREKIDLLPYSAKKIYDKYIHKIELEDNEEKKL